MDVTFLGTSAGVPTSRRNVSALALRHGGSWDLFDCGEGTQHQLMRTPLSVHKLDRVFISHLHGDHCLGLFGLLGSRSMNNATKPLTVIGPPGLRSMVETVLSTTATHLSYPLDFVEVPDSGGRVADAIDHSVVAFPLTHRVTSHAWLVTEADRPGHFDAEKASALGVAAGPDFGRLRRGESVTLEDGTIVAPDDLVGPPQRGRRIVVAGDNSDPVRLLTATGAVDVLVHEATYTEPIVESIGDDHGHSTAARVARAAQEHGVANLVLTHFSPRYTDSGPGPTIDDLFAEAREHFDGNLHLAEDFDTVEVSKDGSSMRLGE